jgi:hypothetical protein
MALTLAFADIDERLKTIEQASGLYNASQQPPATQRDEISPDRRRSVENRSQFYSHPPEPQRVDRQQMLARMREDGDKNPGVDHIFATKIS